MIRVLIADDHHLVRQGIRALLEKENFEVIGEASNGHEAVALTAELTPDVVVMDIAMPSLDGIQATTQIVAQEHNAAVVILSMHTKPSIVQRALRYGAKGYVLKNSLSEELMMAIPAAAQGKTYLSPIISESLLKHMWRSNETREESEHSEILTPREKQVLQLIAEGNTNSEIAKELVISIKTVEKHRANLMTKLNVSDLPTLLRKAVEYGLVFYNA